MNKFTTDGEKLFINGEHVVKGWESFTGWYWFATEADHIQDSVINGKVHEDDQIWFGLVQGHEDEWGCFSQAEIESLGNRTWPIKAVDLLHAGRR